LRFVVDFAKLPGMPTELERIETLERRNETLERELAELKAKVSSIETDLALIPGLITTGFRQMESRFAQLRTHMDERFDATIRAVAEIVGSGK
jgi:predicted RNase H-like nuclease (RuvC/YqgF family)